MLLIESQSTNPYLNIASEEYLLKQFEDDIFLMYRNQPSIVIGKHQNVYKEINYEFVRKEKLKIVRRISGGGAVYHDLGNLNFAFITNGEPGKFVDFKKYTKPIMQFFNTIGVQVELGERNNLFINDKKISGNAEHIHKSRVLHHGTLLFSTDLEKLRKAIASEEKSYYDTSINSVRANVTNICDYLPNDMDSTEFSNRLFEFIEAHFSENQRYTLTENDTTAIAELARQKYRTWDWNFGYLANYELNKAVVTRKTSFNVHLKTEKAVITSIKFSFENFPFDKICQDLIGVNHEYSAIFDKCWKYKDEINYFGIDIKDFVYYLF